MRLSVTGVVDTGDTAHAVGGRGRVPKRSNRKAQQPDLFSVDPTGQVLQRLDALSWPVQERFPVNRASAKVRHVVWDDLAHSGDPVLVAGYSSIGEFVRFIADWSQHEHEGTARVVLGAEPFPSVKRSFAEPRTAFTDEVQSYWLDRGISLRLSAQVLIALDAVKAGRVDVRIVHGSSPLHAKVFVGSAAATTGSSNFTGYGLSSQVEVNARFERATDRRRYEELALVADNLWTTGTDWNDKFTELLEQLLRVVTWREALARACAELLEGDWAAALLQRVSSDGAGLWPSQLVGIAQAMWIIDNVGSVLVADATGSGKTRMGAHLVRAVQDRLWSTGRVRSGLTVLVCPPAVEDTWRHEAVSCGLTINTVSHGKLSRSPTGDPRIEQAAVRCAQLLAVDEAHNFLNRASNRTRFVRQNLADHVLLFTATPISRGATDLLELVALLGPDNFEDETHETLQRLERRGAASGLTPEEELNLRSEIQRFTLRRTKTQINSLVDRDVDAYIHPTTERVCRYPTHHAQTYDTGETTSDSRAADEIRRITAELSGIGWLPQRIAVPKSLRQVVRDERWLNFRLASAAGLATHHVLGALRSSRAALFEHLHGTLAAAAQFGLPDDFKSSETGGTIEKVRDRSACSPPTVELDCVVPEWLTDPEAWRAECEEELHRYEQIAAALAEVSDARERCKARLLLELATRHDRVLAFDQHLITLSTLRSLLGGAPCEVLIATGQAQKERKRVEELFAPAAEGRAIGLCSDAMNEGLNLQGAAAIVHLDLPTTLRVAEQRVGRVDRMDSPHDEIEAWWPRDGISFATRANERLARRAEESESLLGSNLPLPRLVGELVDADPDTVIDVEQVQREVEELMSRPADDLFDAIDPVRQLTAGPDALISPAEYQSYRASIAQVIARVAPIASVKPWAFFAIRSSSNGAPRWMFIDPESKTSHTRLNEIVDQLRSRLREDPPNQHLDEAAAQWLEVCLEQATAAEVELLPRRMRRALRQMRTVTGEWQRQCQRASDEVSAGRWAAIASAASAEGDDAAADPVAVAERWLQLIAPVLDQHRRENPRRRYVLIDDVTSRLAAQPFDLAETEAAFFGVPDLPPLADRVSACILGVPATG